MAGLTTELSEFDRPHQSTLVVRAPWDDLLGSQIISPEPDEHIRSRSGSIGAVGLGRRTWLIVTGAAHPHGLMG